MAYFDLDPLSNIKNDQSFDWFFLQRCNQANTFGDDFVIKLNDFYLGLHYHSVKHLI